MKTECDYLCGWIKKWSHMQKSHQKMVNPTDIAWNSEEEEKKPMNLLKINVISTLSEWKGELSLHNVRLNWRAVHDLRSAVVVTEYIVLLNFHFTYFCNTGTSRLTRQYLQFLSCGTESLKVRYILSRAGTPAGTLSLWLLFVRCLTSKQHASVSQGWICTDNLTCRHTEIKVADQTSYLTQS